MLAARVLWIFDMTDKAKSVELLAHIGNELKLLWWQLEAWQELFDVEQEKRASLLRATAPSFFIVTQVALAESILMRISRLMDKEKVAGNENASLQNFQRELPSDAHQAWREEIQSLLDDWQRKIPETKDEAGPYARLKVVRNKWLAHNDWAQRSERSPSSLWMPLTHAEFAVAQQLAGRLWALYRMSYRYLHGTDVIEPQHECLENRSAMVLKHLSASLYLNRLVSEDFSKIQSLRDFEQQSMGEDRIRDVFAVEGGRNG